jgi:tetratricopeptide (TPR) repeat protein
MIVLLPQLTPSELLYYEGTASFVADLLQRSRSRRLEGRLFDAERFAVEALAANREASDYVSLGMNLICLADARREMGKLGLALSDCQRAHRTFQSQPSRYQRHNESVAAYALGLVHHLLGNDVDALKWYQAASKQLDKARREWAAVNALTRVKDCDRILCWLKTLTQYLIAAGARLDVNLFSRVQVPVIHWNSGSTEFAIAELEIDRYRIRDRLTIGSEVFELQSIKEDQRVSLKPGAECYALEIPEEVYELLGASEGDYALVVRGKDADREGPGVLETLGGTEFGDFRRDKDGRINFIRSDATVIGLEGMGDDLQVGYIAALLKPM